MIYLIGLIIACFLFLLILLKKQKTRQDRVLFAWICFLIAHLFLFYLHYTKIEDRYPHVLGILLPMPLLHGVFLYWYTIALTRKGFLTTRVILLHLLPYLVLNTAAISFYRLSASEKLYVFRHEGEGFEWYSVTLFMLILLSGFSYTVAVILEIRRYRKQLLDHFSNDEKRMLRWLEYMALALGIIWLLSAFFEDTVVFAGAALFVLFIGFFGINQVPVFYSGNPGSIVAMQEDEQPAIQEKYARTGLKEDEIPEIMARLEDLMQTEKPYKNGELTLSELADALAVPANQLSQVINSMSGKTFFHYINTCRIVEFMEIAALPENKKYTFLALAYDCGFNSKTTFNKYFKLHTGKTPSEYFE